MQSAKLTPYRCAQQVEVVGGDGIPAQTPGLIYARLRPSSSRTSGGRHRGAGARLLIRSQALRAKGTVSNKLWGNREPTAALG